MKYIIVIISAIFLFSCSAQNKLGNTEKSSEKAKIETTDIVSQLHDIWALEEISNQKIEELGKFIKRPQLEIFVKDMRVVGNDGCNQFSGEIDKLDGKSIVFGPLMSTRMACLDMTVSDKFNQVLGKVASHKRDGLKLVLFDIKGIELLQFQKTD